MPPQIVKFLYAIFVLLSFICPLTNGVAAPIAQGSEEIICQACSDKQDDGSCQDRKTCDPGKVMNPENGCQCECSAHFPLPYTTDPVTCEQMCPPRALPCPDGQVEDPATCQCDCPSSKSKCCACPEGQYLDGAGCKCPGGQYPDGTECKSCPAGQYFNGTVCTTCPGGQYVAGTVCKCPDGQYFDGTTCKCPGGQSLVGTTCKCSIGQSFDGTVCTLQDTATPTASPTPTPTETPTPEEPPNGAGYFTCGTWSGCDCESGEETRTVVRHSSPAAGKTTRQPYTQTRSCGLKREPTFVKVKVQHRENSDDGECHFIKTCNNKDANVEKGYLKIKQNEYEWVYVCYNNKAPDSDCPDNCGDGCRCKDVSGAVSFTKRIWSPNRFAPISPAWLANIVCTTPK